MKIEHEVVRTRHALVIAYGFPPNGGIGTMRTLRVVRQLAESGWRVTVVTASPDDYRAGTPVDPALVERVPTGVVVVRSRVIRPVARLATWLARRLRRRSIVSSPRASGMPTRQPDASAATQPTASLPRRLARLLDAILSIPDQEVGWTVPGTIACLRAMLTHPPVDVIYSSSPPWTGQLIAWVVASLTRKPWLADFRDPWARAPWREDRPAIVVRILSFLERSFVARADAVTFAPPGVHREFSQFYGSELNRRFFLIPNGCDASEFEGLVPAPDPGRVILLHAGSLYGGRRDPTALLEALSRLISTGTIDRSSFRLRMLGVDAPEGVRQLAHSHGLGDVVELLPRVGRRESLQQMVSASVLLLLQPGHGALPGKLYEYMAASRPILALVDDPLLTELVESCGFGFTAGAGNVPAIEGALTACLAFAANRVAATPRELYDGTPQARKIVELLDALAGGKSLPSTP